mmetsp:Transcript_3508/g.6340  ORF Transcript_3508/g.6340 Transcript_3508/m.6340 type:complete len:581 (+) Transcript_3508:72-1814(+)
MTLLATFALLWCLAAGNRIQYLSLYPDKFQSEPPPSQSDQPTEGTRILLESDAKYFYNRSVLEIQGKAEIEINGDQTASFNELSVSRDDVPRREGNRGPQQKLSIEVASFENTAAAPAAPEDDEGFDMQAGAEVEQGESGRYFAVNAEALTSSLAQVNLGRVDPQNYIKATQTEVVPELDNTVTPSSNTAAEADADMIDLQANAVSTGREILAELEASVIPRIETSDSEKTDDDNLQGDAKSEPSLQEELETRSISTINTAAEDAAEDDHIASSLQDDAKMKLGEYAQELFPRATVADLDDVDLQVDDKKKQKKSVPVVEVSVTPLTASPVEENSDFIGFQGHAKATRDKNRSHKDNLASTDVAVVAMGNRSAQRHPGDSVSSLIQMQASGLHMPHQSGDPFSTNINAFSWNYFSSVPSPVFVVFIGAALVTIISWFIGSFRFCFSRQLICGFLKYESRQQHFHHGCMVYEWDQTFKAVTIYLRPPEGQLANDLDIRISSRQLQVGRKGRHSFLKEETYDLVNAEMSSWSLESDGELKIVLRKVRKSRWPVALLHNSKLFASPVAQSDAPNLTLKPIEVM